MVDDLGFYVLVDVLASRYKLDSYICAFVELILRELNKSKCTGVQVFTLFIAFMIREWIRGGCCVVARHPCKRQKL